MDTINKHFITLLKAYDAYDKFIGELHREDTSLTLRKYLHKYHPSQYVNFAFNWFSSKEGTKFWSLIHYKWLDILLTLPLIDEETKKFIAEDMCTAITPNIYESDCELIKQSFSSEIVIQHLFDSDNNT